MQGLTRFFVLFFLCGLQSSTTKAQTQLFTEVSDQVGLDYIYPGNDFQMAGGGLMIIDVNNDGWEDFFQSGGVFDSKLWINHEGKFKDETAKYGLDGLSGYFIQGAVSADYNNDGYQDFLIVNYGIGMGRGDKHSPLLLRNNKGVSFEIVDLSDVLEPGDYTSACWGDFNKDGFSDVYITNYVATMSGLYDTNDVEMGYNPTCYENKLLVNVRGESFVEAATEFGLNNPGCGLAASFTDIDNDNDLDLLLLNDFGEWTGNGNRCFRNNYPDSSFTDISSEVGFDHQMYGMGIGPGDYDQDGDLDYYVTNIGRNYLYNNTKGQFTDTGKELGLDISFVYDTVRGTSWSGLFFDMEFDGDLDLFVSKGNIATLVPKTALSDANKLFRNENGSFEEATKISGLGDILSHRGSVVFDYDHDGDLDILSSIVKLPWSAFAKREQKLKLYRNDQKVENWIGVRLKGGQFLNTDCFGCKVYFSQGDKIMLKEVDGGSGHASQTSRILYFGLGDAKRLETLKIDWTNGTVDTFTGLKAGNVYDIDASGQVKRSKQF